MTRRERMEQRADNREAWAASATRKAEERSKASARYVEGIPFGQPILVGHHSEKRHRRALENSWNAMGKAVELSDKAKRHEQVADTLRDRLETVIFSDDENAIAELETRIAEREAERDRIKAFNASCRKGSPDLSLLTDDWRMRYERLYKQGPLPAYALSNLSGRIKADRDRIKSIQYRNAKSEKAEAAGGMLITRSSDGEYCNVTFAEKPERSVINALKEARFYWSGGSWGGCTANLPAVVLEMERDQQQPE